MSNRGGWQSKPDFMHNEFLSEFVSTQNECILEILKEDYNSVSYMLNNFWANVNTAKDYNISHTHPGSNLSSCFYVKTPGGALEFTDPRPSAEMESNRFEMCAENYGIYAINPEEGDLVVFPSWLMHRVTQSEKDEDRVSISSNYLLKYNGE
jgi:uncharacterized protein (TIGR02466 family)